VTLALLPTRGLERSDVVARGTKPGRWRPIPVLVQDGRRVSMPVSLERNREFWSGFKVCPTDVNVRWLRPSVERVDGHRVGLAARRRIRSRHCQRRSPCIQLPPAGNPGTRLSVDSP
jgi:hypothetical protein